LGLLGTSQQVPEARPLEVPESRPLEVPEARPLEVPDARPLVPVPRSQEVLGLLGTSSSPEGPKKRWDYLEHSKKSQKLDP